MKKVVEFRKEAATAILLCMVLSTFKPSIAQCIIMKYQSTLFQSFPWANHTCLVHLSSASIQLQLGMERRSSFIQRRNVDSLSSSTMSLGTFVIYFMNICMHLQIKRIYIYKYTYISIYICVCVFVYVKEHNKPSVVHLY